jgi:hypothetical protein
MIVTKHFNILLFPKCGTHYIASVFEKTKDDIQKQTGIPVIIDVTHLPASKLPYGRNENPTGVVIRNIWDWYVSRYFFIENARINKTGAYHITDNRKEATALKKWAKYCAHGNTISGFKKHLPFAVEHFPVCDSFFQFIADAPRIYFLRHEELGNDLSEFVSVFSRDSAHCYLSTLKAIREQKAVNVTANRPDVSDCYTEKQIEMVYQVEQKYIQRFKQEFNF